MLHFCTYFDSNYLSRALVLYRSLVELEAEFVLWALCLDDEAYRIVTELRLPGLEAVALADLEQADPEAAATQGSRSRVEYYFTLTPSLPRYLLAQHPEVELISYLDADLRFYTSPAGLIDAMAKHSVMIIPHGFPSHLSHLEVYGRYNVGMVSFRRDADGLACLSKWREQCIEWCFDRVDKGRFADQAYLNDWPDTYSGVLVLDRPGVGLGPWNFMRFKIDTNSVPPRVDGHPLVFYHFHAFRSLGAHVFDDGLAMYGRMPRRLRQYLYAGYIRALESTRSSQGPSDPSAPTARTQSRPGMGTLLRLLAQRRLLVRVGRFVFG
jgi:hypothetical protein